MKKEIYSFLVPSIYRDFVYLIIFIHEKLGDFLKRCVYYNENKIYIINML